MLHDGTTYRLYLRSRSSPTLIHQFGYNAATQSYEYGSASIPTLTITGSPVDTDHNRWSMLHDGTTYRYYAFQRNSSTVFYQFGYNTTTQSYEYGLSSIPTLTVTGMPSNSNTSSFAVLHDGTNYRFYFQTSAGPG
jgi:hypothetical protein